MNDDASLLRRFVQQRANDAFAELVRRHLNLVYFAALRQTHGNTHRAEEAAQSTFTFLAQKADSLLAHPNLAGWLHTVACHHARDLNRAEQRRLQREQTAAVMHELTSAESNDKTWMQVRPVIDDALQDLTPDDREAVLLRFFENRPFAEIGAELRLGENAARMRVTRALSQLETALARRGVKSTSAALATVLAIPAAMAAPAGLASTLSSTALAATTLVGTGATALTLFKIMSSAKLIATATTLVAFVALGTTVYQHEQLQSSREETAALRQQQTDLQARLAKEKTRADEAEADNDKFLAATASMIIDKKTAKPSEIVIDHDSVQARYDKAKQLDGDGRYEEALAEYLWCFDTGMMQVASYKGVRVSFLLHAIAELGTKYPPALDALRERRDKAQQQFLANATDRNALADFSRLNRYLGDNDKSLEVFNSLAPDDKRRGVLAFDVKDQLLEAKRYNDLVSAYPYKTIVRQFDALTDSEHMPKGSAREITRLKQYAARSAADNIEALAGSGDVSHAAEFITKVLAVDNSAETRAIIQVHLTRAGHPELLKAQ